MNKHVCALNFFTKKSIAFSRRIMQFFFSSRRKKIVQTNLRHRIKCVLNDHPPMRVKVLVYRSRDHRYTIIMCVFFTFKCITPTEPQQPVLPSTHTHCSSLYKSSIIWWWWWWWSVSANAPHFCHTLTYRPQLWQQLYNSIQPKYLLPQHELIDWFMCVVNNRYDIIFSMCACVWSIFTHTIYTYGVYAAAV